MADYCSNTDVEERLGRSLTTSELNQFPALLLDVTTDVDDIVGKSYADASPIPDVLLSVSANMLKRTYQTNSANPLGVDTTVGPVRITAIAKMLPSEEKKLRNFAARNGGPKGIGTIGTYRGDVRSPYDPCRTFDAYGCD